MTQLLKQALDEVKNCPAPEQDANATFILDELADKQRWKEIGTIAAFVGATVSQGARDPGRPGQARWSRKIMLNFGKSNPA